jgi:translation initiation factor IF-3
MMSWSMQPSVRSLTCLAILHLLVTQIALTADAFQGISYQVRNIVQSTAVIGSTSFILYSSRPPTANRPKVGGGPPRNNNNKRYQGKQQQKTDGKDPNRPMMNEEITFNELRVVTPSPNGKDVALGIMSRAEVLEKAKELGGLDVIVINEGSVPPVCKIVDYSKYKYSLEKKAKEVKKNSKASELKEIKMSYKIDIHDYDVRKKSATKFIKQGNRVKCTVMFRGREMQHDKLGFELLDKLASELDSLCIQEGRPKREGRNLSLMLSPKPEVLRAVNDARKAAKKAKVKSTSTSSETGNDEDDDDDDDDDINMEDDEDYDDDDEDYDDDNDDDDEKATIAVSVGAGSGKAPPKKEKTLEDILGTTDYL